MTKEWERIETEVRRIANGYVASVIIHVGYPEYRTDQTYFKTLAEAVQHCAAIASDEAQIAAIISTEPDDGDQYPF